MIDLAIRNLAQRGISSNSLEQQQNTMKCSDSLCSVYLNKLIRSSHVALSARAVLSTICPVSEEEDGYGHQMSTIDTMVFHSNPTEQTH